VSLEAEGLALDMFVTFDNTASMNDPVGRGANCPWVLGSAPSVGSKWCYATHALAEYFTWPYATGHRAALQFMSTAGYVWLRDGRKRTRVDERGRLRCPRQRVTNCVVSSARARTLRGSSLPLRHTDLAFSRVNLR
jgi:hypothetical protein